MPLSDIAQTDDLLNQYVAENNWGKVRNLLLDAEILPGKSLIAMVLAKAALSGQVDLTATLCEMNTDNQPDQESVSNILIKVVDAKQWPVVEYLCGLQTTNQPEQNAVCHALANAAEEHRWNTVTLLCLMNGNNKPDKKTVTFVLEKAAFANNIDVVSTIVYMKTDNRPEVTVVDDACNKLKEFLAQAKLEQLQAKAKLNEMIAKKRGKIIAEFLKEWRVSWENIEKEKRQKITKKVMLHIDMALIVFERKINSAEHYSENVYQTAIKLLDDLRHAQREHVIQLNDLNNCVSTAKMLFKDQCEQLITNATPVLARDLEWGDYLVNLLKTITNAIIWGVTFGQVNSFFKLVPSESLQAVEEMEKALDGIFYHSGY